MADKSDSMASVGDGDMGRHAARSRTGLFGTTERLFGTTERQPRLASDFFIPMWN